MTGFMRIVRNASDDHGRVYEAYPYCVNVRMFGFDCELSNSYCLLRKPDP